MSTALVAKQDQDLTTAPEAEASAEGPAVPPGYKQTEVGVIPEEWDTRPLGSCLREAPAYGINAPAVPYSDSLPAYIRITDIDDEGHFAPQTPVSVRHNDAPRYYLQSGDIVLARTGASVGKSYLYNGNDGPLVFAGFLIRIRPNSDKALPQFIASIFRTPSYWRWVNVMSMRSGQPGINGAEYSQFPLPIPSLAEQKIISVAIDDVTKLLDHLEALIEKKRAIKTAAMQQLLTGRQRLPDYSTEWVKRPLQQIAPLQRGFDLPTNRLRTGTYPVVYSNGILHTHAEFMVKGPGVATGRSGTIGKVHYTEEDYWPHNTTLWVTDFRGNHPKFIFYLYTYANLERLSSGSGVPTLNRNDIHALSWILPSSYQEQAAIAKVLSDMDAEIAALEARRDKVKALKQGMMQELLTGRTRLV